MKIWAQPLASASWPRMPKRAAWRSTHSIAASRLVKVALRSWKNAVVMVGASWAGRCLGGVALAPALI